MFVCCFDLFIKSIVLILSFCVFWVIDLYPVVFRGICTTQDERAVLNMKTLIPPLAKAYLTIFEDAKVKREFFGLRDFYR